MKNFDFLYNTVICSYLLMKKLTVLLALRHFSWLVSLTPLQASTWLPHMADWLKNGCRGCFVGACHRVVELETGEGIYWGQRCELLLIFDHQLSVFRYIRGA